MTKNKRAKKKKSTAKRKTAKLQNKRVLLCVILSAVLFIGIISGIIAANKTHKPFVYDFNKSVANGIDVSSHNGKIDWQKAADEIDFAFIRVGCRGYSDGNIFLDKRAKRNMRMAGRAGVPYGVYFYSQAITVEEAEEEARFLLRHIRNYNVKLPLVYDFEYAYAKSKPVGRLVHANLSNQDRTDMINAFCKVVKKAGYSPALYASTYVYESLINVRSLDKDCVIWVADYNPEITYDGYYDIWQASESGSCRGVSSKNVDIDYWYSRK